MFCSCAGLPFSSAICRNDFLISFFSTGGFDHGAAEMQVCSFSHPRNVTQTVLLFGCNHCIPEGRDAYLLLLFLLCIEIFSFEEGYIK